MVRELSLVFMQMQNQIETNKRKQLFISVYTQQRYEPFINENPGEMIEPLTADMNTEIF